MRTGGKDVWQNFKVYLKKVKTGQRRWEKARQKPDEKWESDVSETTREREVFQKGVECDFGSTMSKISDRSNKSKKNWKELNWKISTGLRTMKSGPWQSSSVKWKESICQKIEKWMQGAEQKQGI